MPGIAIDHAAIFPMADVKHFAGSLADVFRSTPLRSGAFHDNVGKSHDDIYPTVLLKRLAIVTFAGATHARCRLNRLMGNDIRKWMLLVESYDTLLELENLQEIGGWRKGLAVGALALGAMTGAHSAQAPSPAAAGVQQAPQTIQQQQQARDMAGARNQAVNYYNTLVKQFTEINQAADAEQGAQQTPITAQQIHAIALKKTQQKFGIASNPGANIYEITPAFDAWGNPTRTTQPKSW